MFSKKIFSLKKHIICTGSMNVISWAIKHLSSSAPPVNHSRKIKCYVRYKRKKKLRLHFEQYIIWKVMHGPDGMTIGFYKKTLGIIKSEVIEFVQEFFITNKEVNETMIILLYKRSQPSNIHHYSPIILCNVSYKIISKI